MYSSVSKYYEVMVQYDVVMLAEDIMHMNSGTSQSSDEIQKRPVSNYDKNFQKHFKSKTV